MTIELPDGYHCEPAPVPLALGSSEGLGSTFGETMRQTHDWPGLWWSKVPPQVEDHPQGRELAWMARGYPFNRPVIARSNVGVKCISPQGIGGGQIIKPTYGPFVRVELMADSFHGQDASAFGWFRDLEWMGPLVLPNVAFSGVPAGHVSNHPAGGTSAATRG